MQRQSFAHSPLMGVLMAEKTLYLKPQDVFVLKFYGIVLTCSCAMSGSFVHSPWAHGGAHGQNPLISQTAVRIFSDRIYMELSRHVILQRQGHLPICPYGHAHGRKTLFYNHWRDFLCSKFCEIVWPCSCATSESFVHSPPMGVGVPMGKKLCFCNSYIDFLRLKFFGIVYTCSCAVSWSFVHLPSTVLSMGQIHGPKSWAGVECISLKLLRQFHSN